MPSSSRILCRAYCVLLVAHLAIGQTKAPPSPAKKQSGPAAIQPGSLPKSQPASGARPIRGTLSVSTTFLGITSDGKAAMGGPFLVLATAEGSFQLRSTPRTQYYGVDRESLESIFAPAGEYEVVGRRIQGSTVDGVKYTLELTSIRFLKAAPPARAREVTPSIMQGIVSRIDPAAGKVSIERGAQTVELWIDASTEWTGVSRLSEVLPSDKVTVEYLVQTPEGDTMPYPEGSERIWLGRSGFKAVAKSIAIDTSGRQQ